MKALPVLAALALFLTLPPSQASAQGVPLAISYQAVLTDDSGDVISPTTPTNYAVVFRIYDAVEEGTLLWAEAQSVSVYQGSFSTLLGTGDEVSEEPYPQLDTVFDDALRYLEITITESATPKTFVPRQRMVSAPFAFRSRVAEQALTVVDSAIATSQLSNAAVTADKMSVNSVSGEAIQSNAVGASQIATNAVGSAEIATGAVNMNELAAAVANRLVPAGTVVAWAGSKEPVSSYYGGIPEGWLLCDGRQIEVSQYPELWRAIGPVYGYTGSHFNLPDYRGYFMRGQAETTAQDPDLNSRAQPSGYGPSYGGGVGTTQGDQFRSHNHNNGNYSRLGVLAQYTGASRTWDGDGDYSGNEPDLLATSAIQPRGGSETRPKNRSVWYIIKAH